MSPPKYPLRFLYWFCKPDLLEEIEGDLNEEFEERIGRLGLKKARWLYAWQVLTFFRPYTIKSLNIPVLNFIPMYSHYGKIAFRNFVRQKLHTTINVLSLAIGIACATLIYLYLQNEWSFDSYHEKADDIYRISRAWYDDNGNIAESSAVQSLPFGITIAEDLPEIQQMARFYESRGYIKQGEVKYEEEFLMADPAALQIFTFKPIYGNLDKALESPNELVLSEKMATKYFGKTNPAGQALQIYYARELHEFTVKAVVENPPENSTVKFDFMLPFEFLLKRDEIQEYNHWGINFLPTYVLLDPNTNMEALNEKLPALRASYFEGKKASRRDSLYTASYYFQPLKDIHFNTEIKGVLSPSINPQYAYILGGIGLAILLLACINFMILAVGRSARRAREIGLRKVVGAKKRQLMAQFLSEAVILSMLGLWLGIAFVGLALPTFNELAEKQLVLEQLLQLDAILILVGVTVLSGLIAGSYPAFLLSNFRTVSSLRNQYKLGGTNLFTRILVSMQFSMSIVLIIGTLVMTHQIQYLNNKSLGFDEEELMVVHRQGAVDAETFYQTYKDRLTQNPRVVNLSATTPVFTKGIISSNFQYNGGEIPYNIIFVDANYIKTMGMKMAMGRDFNPELASDSTQNIIINEAFADALGIEDIIGKRIKGLENADYVDPVVVGVVQNFHFSSLREEVSPVWLAMNDYSFNHLLIRIQTGEVRTTISEIENIWNEMAQDVPFKYSFMDEDLASQYESEERWRKVVNAAAVLAIFISCMGLFGLVALSVAGRTKEIGIRKVLGASLGQLSLTLSKEFSVLILIAFVIAIPIGWYLSTEWLQNFAYRIAVSPALFMLAGLMILGIFLLTMSYHIIKAGRANPIDALRHE